MQIYLDYSATTPPRAEVITAMQGAMAQHWGNPSSLHVWGNRAATALERSRLQVASLINAADPTAILFTAGGTEANNLAISGVANRFTTPKHIIVSTVEHAAVAEPVRQLAARGWQITWLPVDEYGLLAPADLQAALQPNTALVSLIYGQSEIGTLQPIAELGAIAQSRGVLFHTDAVQVAGRLPIDVQQLPVDLLSLSSHKLYGPQGAGALYANPQARQALSPILSGGGQEQGLRSGTQALPTIVGFGVAAELAAAAMPTETLRLIHLRDRLFSLMAPVQDLVPTGHPRQRLPHHVSFRLAAAAMVNTDAMVNADANIGANSVSSAPAPLTGKSLVRQMNLAGIGISAGSACHSGQLTPSPILKALGHSDAIAKTGIRLTLGDRTTEADIDWSALVLKQILARSLPQPIAV